MELRGLYVAAEEDCQMVTSEMEAAEALTGLARCSAVRGVDIGSDELTIPSRNLVKESMVSSSRCPAQDEAIAVQQSCENTPNMVRSGLETEETVRILPSHLCSTSYETNSASKLRQSLKEAEKEEQRLRRILANRESARQTICRRQAMHQELTRKSAHLAQENEILKKETERALEEYNSLKGRNEFLKLQMTNVKKSESRETKNEQIKSSQKHPIFSYNHPSFVPFFLPLISPSSNIVQLQFPMQDKDIIPTSHQGNPFFILPVPCLLPFGITSQPCSDNNGRQNETSSKHECIVSSSSDTFLVPAKDETNKLDSNFVPEHVTECSVKKNHGKRDIVFAATKARRRRKELMRLKYIRCHHHFHKHNAKY